VIGKKVAAKRREVEREREGGCAAALPPCPPLSPSLFVSIWRKIFSVLFSGVDSSSGIFITDETIL
jgi:hypothetical protein